MSQDLFKEKWMKQAEEKFRLAYPNDSIKDIRKFLNKMYERDYVNSECILYNNYEKEEAYTTINDILNWLDEAKPIPTESGSIFKQHKDSWNPNTIILNKFLTDRAKEKKEKFRYMNLAKEETDPVKSKEYSDLSMDYDLKQSRSKVKANSEYGVSGLVPSWFFNMACASATTARGQALISTAYNAFDDFLSDNVTFNSMDECIEFINNIVNEEKIRTKNDAKWVENKDKEQVLSRLLRKFASKNIADISLISRILDGLNQENLNRIYYKSNIYEFFRNSTKAQSLLYYIVNSKEPFLEPKKPPIDIKNKVDKLRSAVLEYVHYNYQFTNRVYRLKTSTRKSVIVIDTDSNFINLGPWVDYVTDEILTLKTKVTRRKYKKIISSRSKKTKKIDEQLLFKIINTMANIIEGMMSNVLSDFLKRSNISEDNPGNTSMKNEFLYETILTTPAKKHYQANIILQEGNRMKGTGKMDIKGCEYIKPSVAGEDTRKFIKKLIYDDILLQGENIDIPKVLRKLSDFEDGIIKSVLSGENKYIKTANIKTADAYSNPMSIGQYKAAFVWNYLYPDKQIELPGIAHMLKVKLTKPKDFAQLSVTNPDIFEKLMELFKDKSFTGITTLAIPMDETYPEWLTPYINLDEIISNNVSIIHNVLNCLGIKTINRTKSNAFFSNIIKL